jgi:hypothetical protein
MRNAAIGLSAWFMLTRPRSEESGRGERIRTSDPLLPKQVRYQTALHPDA